ncbi:MAG: hypothetical protein HN855_11285 [Anaerolineae bacterium]|jgi:hypothetical protein|nr:hypothetical protein [Anaerolineae bacterium]MBT7070532.1 hypothetical protein [Anaerolineae bacterium]MBT7325736.1 hypothetical protein [Anaerolineae bacterium]
MTFQQKNITVTLVNFLLILGFYLIRVTQLILIESFTLDKIIGVWVTVVVMAIVVTIIGTILTHIISTIIEVIKTGNEEPEVESIQDERDELIDLKGTRVTNTVYSFSVLLAMLTFALGQPALVMFTLLILCGIIAQIAGDIFRLRLYRKGF